MKIVVAGGSGFVGKKLTTLLHNDGHEVVILTRGKSRMEKGMQFVQWLSKEADPVAEIRYADAFVNLAGVSLNSGRWTEKKKHEIYASRMQATSTLIDMMTQLSQPPKVLVNASAVGIYPASQHMIYTEEDKIFSQDFLGSTVRDWERMANRAQALNVRVATGRFGVILGQGGGALPLMALPYHYYVGGPIGSGKQWLSWVHVDDVARALYFAITTPELIGPFNVTAPHALRMADFVQVLSDVLHKPNWLAVPSFVLQIALGEQSKLVLEGQHVVPQQLEKHGFEFKYPTAQQALENIYA